MLHEASIQGGFNSGSLVLSPGSSMEKELNNICWVAFNSEKKEQQQENWSRSLEDPLGGVGGGNNQGLRARTKLGDLLGGVI